MQLTQFRPDISLQISKKYFTFISELTQSISVFSKQSHLGIYSTTQKLGPPILSAVNFEKQFCPKTPGSILPGEYHDTTPNSHTTGGGRRTFISVPFEHCIQDAAGPIIGASAILSWTRDQRSRPVCWDPWEFIYNDYWGQIGSDFNNPIAKYDKQNESGWDIFDPAHLESSALYSGSIIGLDESLHHFVMLLAWVVSSFPGKSTKFQNKPAQGWHGSRQPRAIALMIWLLTRASLMDIDSADQEFIDKFLQGYPPKEHLIAYVKDLLSMNLQIGADHVDNRTMVDIGIYNGQPEIQGDLGFQEAILFASLGYLLRTKILNDPLQTQLKEWLHSRITAVVARAVNSSGMSYSFSTHNGFGQDAVDLANQKETDKGHVYERTNDGFIRDIPRVPDIELMLGGLAFAGFPEFQDIMNNLVALLPNPYSDPNNYAPKATYADPFFALNGTFTN